MKCVFILLLLGLASAANKPHFRFPAVENKDKDDAAKQKEINKLFVGLSKIEPHDSVPFPYSDTRYYRNKEAVGKFMAAWDEGFIDKDSFFSLYHYKNRHDTYRFFDILFFARNYDAFMNIAKWARNELHPLQFVYGMVAAIIHRSDTSGIYLPKFYEILPQYFVAADVIHLANKAAIFGNRAYKFEMNNTGYEYSWYKGNVLESFKSAPKWDHFDVESRLSYFTEDIMLADFMAKTTLAYAPWISDEKYPEINQYRKGESLFHLYKHLLTKYNLERYANDLPPAKPLDFKMEVESGYNSHLATLHGRPFTPRPDVLVPFFSNPEGVHDLLNTKSRYDDLTDLLGYISPLNDSFVEIDGSFVGLNRLGELVFGSTHPTVRNKYKPLHYEAFEVLDTAVKASNAIGTVGSVLSNYMTDVRDPVYYNVLAAVNQVFQNYFTKLPPYTAEELEFPGVKLLDFQTSKLATYFENYEFEITNSVPLNSYSGYNYTVSKPRLNNKYFSFNMTIDSDKGRDVVIRSYITPFWDSNYRELSIAEKVQQAVPLFFYTADLKKGRNTLVGDSLHGFYPESMMRDVGKGRVPEGINDYTPKSSRCSFPSNLILPKGGKHYSMFVIVSPFNHPGDIPLTPCSWDLVFGIDQTIDFPTNRRINPVHFEKAENIFFKDMYIHHFDEFHPGRPGRV